MYSFLWCSKDRVGDTDPFQSKYGMKSNVLGIKTPDKIRREITPSILSFVWCMFYKPEVFCLEFVSVQNSGDHCTFRLFLIKISKLSLISCEIFSPFYFKLIGLKFEISSPQDSCFLIFYFLVHNLKYQILIQYLLKYRRK